MTEREGARGLSWRTADKQIAPRSHRSRGERRWAVQDSNLQPWD